MILGLRPFGRQDDYHWVVAAASLQTAKEQMQNLCVLNTILKQ